MLHVNGLRQGLELGESVQHPQLGYLVDLAAKIDLVKHHVELIEVEHKVELTHVLKVCIENLNEEMEQFKVAELVIVRANRRDKVEAGVASVHKLILLVLDEIQLGLAISQPHEPVDLQDHPQLFPCGIVVVEPFDKPGLPLAVEHKDEVYRHGVRLEYEIGATAKY